VLHACRQESTSWRDWQLSSTSSGSAGGARAPRPLRVPPVNPFEHVAELRRPDRNHPISRRRPDEAATLEALGIEGKPEPVVPKDFDQIAKTAVIPHTIGLRERRIPLAPAVRPAASRARGCTPRALRHRPGRGSAGATARAAALDVRPARLRRDGYRPTAGRARCPAEAGLGPPEGTGSPANRVILWMSSIRGGRRCPDIAHHRRPS
jgi:hypothetical protein